MRVLGLDPSFRKYIGWCLLDDRQPVEWGQIDVRKLTDPSLSATTRYVAVQLLILLERVCPDAVAIEKPVANSGMVARAMDAGPGRSAVGRATGGFAATIDLAWIAGALASTVIAFNPAILVIDVNPGKVKVQGAGFITANKGQMKANARLIFAESLVQRGIITDHTQCKLPKEHEADALFIGLEGAEQAERQRLLAMAAY